MDFSQSFDIQQTPTTAFQIATTAISELEISSIDLPNHITLSSTLTPNTKFLVTYKAVFTEKYVQALIWNIPIVSSQFLYNLTENYKTFELKPFQGALFCSSGISDEIYSNYFILLGAKYEQNCSIFIDFLICDNEDSEKYKFCIKYDIPVIKTSQVFSGDYMLFKKKNKYDAKQLKPKAMFFEKVFFLDSRLPKHLFNRLRRIIIENEGTRVSTVNEDTDYILTFNTDDFKEHSSKIIHYQYVFDCYESNALLYPEFYHYNSSYLGNILANTLIAVDKSIPEAREYINKLKSLGSRVKSVLDARCTHYITSNADMSKIAVFSKSLDSSIKSLDSSIKSLENNRIKSLDGNTRSLENKLNRSLENKLNRSFENNSIKSLDGNTRSLENKLGKSMGQCEKSLPFLVVSPEWIDQCIILLKHVKENRFSSNKPVLSLKKRLLLKKDSEMVFQFTGLPSYFKEEIIRKLKKYNIKFIDSEKFEGCTHLIMGHLNSSEKFFCGLVNGCWILTPEFVEDFENQPNFDFEKYEWTVSDNMSLKEKKTVECIRKWRMMVQENNRKPFHRWNVKIYSSESKKESYSSLIVNGGGTLDESKPFTHVFVDKSYKGEVAEEKTLNVDSIFSYLFK